MNITPIPLFGWLANRLFVLPLHGSRIAYRRDMALINWGKVYYTQAVIDECSIEYYERSEE